MSKAYFEKRNVLIPGSKASAGLVAA